MHVYVKPSVFTLTEASSYVVLLDIFFAKNKAARGSARQSAPARNQQAQNQQAQNRPAQQPPAPSRPVPRANPGSNRSCC